MSEQIDGHFGVRLSTVPKNIVLGMDVYIPVRGRAVCFARSGQTLDNEQLRKLRKKKVSTFYIRHEDESEYKKFLDDTLNEVENNNNLALPIRAETMLSLSAAAAQNIIENSENKVVYLKSFKQFERMAQFFVQFNEAPILLIRTIGSQPLDPLILGGETALLSLRVGEKTNKFKETSLRPILIAGCLLQDIALERARVPLPSVHEYTEAQKKIWQEHPVEGVRILGKKDYIDKQVLNIVLQHEEFEDASGFPKKLKASKMDPLAKLASLANHFCIFCQDSKGVKSQSFEEFKGRHKDQHDTELVEALGEVLRALA